MFLRSLRAQAALSVWFCLRLKGSSKERGWALDKSLREGLREKVLWADTVRPRPVG